ncbi:lipopolysaccharide biosynthesis protein RfbH [Dubosiella muris]|uniref:Lipopolysaccharide biosynthesis protein RfbH n=1 Tax=Dubosiella muris TaxID=3038133 RepID=A0AC61R8W0_9FIRM|nr:lipopolysaccharide biosynthesis protein RfbH [Dubosiella muris]TGY66478.1 lipopolysaccharide biosynthesis protein RfbH [Dubosiella muris]
MFKNKTEQEARNEILQMVSEYCDTYHNQNKEYQEGDRIPYASRVYDHDEMVNLVDSSLDFWLTSGRYTDEFEKKLAEYLNVRFCSLVNSGSSANLLAFMTLTSPLLGERRVNRGDEVITVAAGFPTTVTPMIQYGAVPVFVDVTIPGYNIDVTKLEDALSPKTKAVMIAHTLGNPFDLKAVKEFCTKNKLWLIEDNCDALGSTYTIDGVTKQTGTIGDIGTSSFYPPHHMTMGEGGAVYTNNPVLNKIARSFRDWGRDCVCNPGQDNMCGHRFDRQYGELPIGYDHKYVYSHFGYNLKATDMQAAIGCAQLEKFPTFVERRKENFRRMKEGLKGLEEYLILPEATENSDPSWFGFLITCKEGVDRNALVQYIEDKGVQTRMLFAGNLTKHPCFDEMRAEGKGYRIVGDLTNTDRIMNESFWVGLYPGMSEKKIDYMVKVIRNYFEEN